MVLETVATGGTRGLALPELARQLKMHKSSLYRLVATLSQCGYLERSADERFRLGMKVVALASIVINDLDMRRVGSPYLRELSRQVQETVHLTILDNGDVVTVEQIEGDSPLNIRAPIGDRRPLYCTASGKAMLAFLDQGAVNRELARGLKPLTAKTLTDPKLLVAQLQEIRLRGVAFDDEERNQGVRCVAAPIFDHRSDVIGAVSVSVPALRAEVARLEELAIPTAEMARQISERLGFRPFLISHRPPVGGLVLHSSMEMQNPKRCFRPLARRSAIPEVNFH